MTTEADRILALAAETTPGPWTLEVGIDEWGSSYAYIAEVDTDVPTQYTKDAAFIAEVPTLAPVVAEQVKALEAQLDHLLHPSQGETVTLQSRLDDMTAVATSLKAQLYEANERIEKALALHERHKTFEWCRHDPQRQWPCPTVQALTSETEASDV